MHGISAAAIFVGAGLGALLRWALGLALNPVFPTLPLGTLAANALGSLLIGIALGVFAQFESVSPVVRLAVTTGFLGGLTTFSAFSGESLALLRHGDLGLAAAHTLAHVLGALFAAWLGMRLAQALI